MKITLKQLAVFSATARLQGITKAANELCITQSAASQSLKELEAILGFQLFNRIGRELQLNTQGQKVLVKATQMLELQAQLEKGLEDTLQGELLVCASVTIGSYVLPKLLAEFVRLYPQVEPKLHIGNSAQVIEQLQQGQAHIGFVEAPIVEQVLTITPWCSDSLSLFSSPEHPLAKQQQINLDELAKQRLILREHGSGTRSVFVAAMQQQGLEVKNTMDLSRQEAIKQAVKANLGIGVLSQLSIADELQQQQFVQLNSPLNLQRQFSIVQASHYQHSLLVSTFYQFLFNNKPNPWFNVT